MPTDDFQKAVLDQLSDLQTGQGSLKTGLEDLARQVGTIFKKIEGNGQPGISQRLTMIETRCAAVQQQKLRDAEDEASRKGLTWGAWFAIIGAVLCGPVAIVIDHIWK